MVKTVADQFATSVKGRIEYNRSLPWALFLAFPLPFMAILTGGFTAEVGRQPWTVYGVLRTAKAMTPFLTAQTATTSLILYCVVCTFIFAFGTYYIHRLLRVGPQEGRVQPPLPRFRTARCWSSAGTACRRLQVTPPPENSDGHADHY
jgi:cytochrome bd-type quinol oxidase subunit 1